jgi:phosphoglycolate phosphatase-like HAD superfamily hydrolase
MTAVLVLDFDGTMTDAEAEGRPFRDGYLDDLAILVGRRARDPEIAAIADAVEKDLAERPAETPFLWMERAVAPATVDPYLRMATIAHRVLDHFAVFRRADERSRLLGGILYKYNYAKTLERPVFRPGAGDVLRMLVGHQVYVITNSDTEAVAAKLERLEAISPGAGWLAPRVRGFARKFDLADDWTGVPAELAVPGLARPVLLRRRTYHDIIAACLAEAGGDWEELVVVGDIFELDLALPLAMGARIGLVAGARTPTYELDFVAAHPRGRVLASISDVPAFAFGR